MHKKWWTYIDVISRPARSQQLLPRSRLAGNKRDANGISATASPGFPGPLALNECEFYVATLWIRGPGKRG